MLKPLKNKVLLNEFVGEKQTRSLLLLDKPNKEKIYMVVGLGLLQDGEDCLDDIALGDLVMIEKFCGTHINYDGLDYIVINRDLIAGIIKESGND